ncbi:MAG: septation protein IspZ [Alphaproteobacteria bacterium]|nr:septation protein IspZ [Alphaproteobacteria bacterium]
MPLKKSLIKIIKILGIGFSVLYPFIVFLALKEHVALRALAFVLLMAAGVSLLRSKNIWIFVCVLLFGLGLVVYNDDIFLKLYPVLMNVCWGFMFALSLRKTPLSEKIANKMGYELNGVQKQYNRHVTCVWAVFMFCMAAISCVTVFLSDEVWVMFNGLIFYILLAIMTLVEFLVRKKVINVHRDK